MFRLKTFFSDLKLCNSWIPFSEITSVEVVLRSGDKGP